MIDDFLCHEDEIVQHGISVGWSAGRVILEVPYPQGDGRMAEIRSQLILKCEQIHEAIGTAQLAGLIEE